MGSRIVTTTTISPNRWPAGIAKKAWYMASQAVWLQEKVLWFADNKGGKWRKQAEWEDKEKEIHMGEEACWLWLEYIGVGSSEGVIWSEVVDFEASVCACLTATIVIAQLVVDRFVPGIHGPLLPVQYLNNNKSGSSWHVSHNLSWVMATEAVSQAMA